MQTHACPQAAAGSWLPSSPQGQARRDEAGVTGPGPGQLRPAQFQSRLCVGVPPPERGPQAAGQVRTSTLAPSAITYPKTMWFFVENCNPKPKPQGLSGWY